MIDYVHPAVSMSAALDSDPHNTKISTFSGLAFDILDQDYWDFSTIDIAHALSVICRYAGHVEHYSVAEHSLNVSAILKEWGHGADVQLLGLLHDATEAYLLDIPRPWKGEVRIGDRTYHEVESELQEALFDWAGIYDTYREHWDAVHKADMEAYRQEVNLRPNISVYPGWRSVRTAFINTWELLRVRE